MKNNETIIKVENLTKVFKLPHERYSTMKQHFVNIFKPKSVEKLKALDSVSFKVKKGEFFGIIGPNGSGKSTLLKILAQIYQPTAGKIEVNGSISPFIELGVGFNPELSARDNVFLNAAILGLSKKETEERFEEIIKFSELEEFVDQKLKNFSSGMQVRLAFSIAVQAQADILLVDEVLAVGDAAFQQKCFGVFQQLKKKKKTIIFVSHDLGTIEDFCDQVLLINKGKLKFVGSPQQAVLEYLKSNTIESNRQKAEEIAQRKEGKTKIIKALCQDASGNTKEIFEFGEDIVTYFEIKNLEPGQINFGVSIHRLDGVYCFGVNTFLDDQKIKMGSSKISVRFKSPKLLPGSYYLVAAIFGDKKERMIDFQDRIAYFKIHGTATGGGVTYIDHDWSYS